jgi:hypothetical protein
LRLRYILFSGSVGTFNKKHSKGTIWSFCELLNCLFLSECQPYPKVYQSPRSKTRCAVPGAKGFRGDGVDGKTWVYLIRETAG